MDKPKKSAKQSAKERREARIKEQQRQTQILLTIGVVVLVVIVAGLIFVATRPVDAAIPDNLYSYKPFADKGYMGQTAEGYPYLGKVDAPVTMQAVESLSCIVCKGFQT